MAHELQRWLQTQTHPQSAQGRKGVIASCQSPPHPPCSELLAQTNQTSVVHRNCSGLM